ncbi:MAG: SpaA isopeptide-forming pilin-related protein [Actinomycetaceae bacterium]|nr:SpaA isopeptide-forming pilin-related protein [Actinomycetaceae bacterium]
MSIFRAMRGSDVNAVSGGAVSAGGSGALGRLLSAAVATVMAFALALGVVTLPANALTVSAIPTLDVNVSLQGEGNNVRITYTLTNNHPWWNMWWESADGKEITADEVLSDSLCGANPMQFDPELTPSGKYFGIRKDQTATLYCDTTLPEDEPAVSNLVVKSGSFWYGNFKKDAFGPVAFQKNVEVERQNTWADKGDYTVLIPGKASDVATAYADGPSWEITKVASHDYVRPSGEMVTYTYTVTNTGEGKLYYGSMKDDHCWPLKPIEAEEGSGLSEDGIGQFIPAGQSATWTCEAHVMSETVGIVDASFKNENNVVSWAGAATRVGVLVDTNFKGADYGISRCDVIDFSTQNETTGIGNLGSFIPGAGKPEYSKQIPNVEINNKSRSLMTTASATSSQFPEYVYFAASVKDKEGTLGPIGIHRVRKDTPGSIERITGPHSLAVDGTGYRENIGATFTNRLGFDRDGKLWSLNQRGFLFSMELNEEGHAKGDWQLYGKVLTDSSFSALGYTDFKQMELGDIAIDGNNTMWIVASQREATMIDHNGQIISGGRTAGTYLFSLSLNQILSEGQAVPVDESSMIAGTKAHYINQVTFDGSSDAIRGFYGLAFGPNGELYAGFDPSDGDADNLKNAHVYTINPVSGEATHQFDSEAMKGSQDLSSCAFPKSVLSVEKTGAKPSNNGEVEFTITVRNSGNLAAPHVTLTDALQDYVADSVTLNDVAVEDIDGVSPLQNGLSLRSPGASTDIILPGEAAVVRVRAKGKTLGGEVCNTANVGFGTGDDETFLVSDDPTKAGEADETCVPLPYLKVTKTGGNIEEVQPDDPRINDLTIGNGVGWYKSTYTIEVSNPGTVPASYTQVQDAFSYMSKGKEENGLPVRMALNSYWHLGDEEDVAAGNTSTFAVGTEAEKNLAAGESHAYTVTLYFWPEQDYDWRANVEQLCNTATMDGPFDDSENKVCTVPPKPSGEVQITKAAYDPSSDEATVLENLGGAEFALFGANADGAAIDEERKIRDITTSESFEVNAGVYYLVETKAPKGLSLLAKPVRFEVSEKDGKIFVKTNDSLTLAITNPQEKGKPATLQVNDVHSGELPVTGDSGVAPVAIAGGVLALAALALARRQSSLQA